MYEGGKRRDCPREWVPWAVASGNLDAPFSTDGVTFRQLLSYASALQRLSERDPAAVVCVHSADRVDVAAAILSALAGGPRVLFPHILSTASLRELHAIRPFSHVIGPLPDDGAGPGASTRPQALPSSSADDKGDCSTGGHAARVPWVHVDSAAALEAGDGAERCWAITSAHAPLGWLFTGGSTGRQKLWAKSGRELLTESAMIVQMHGFRPDHRLVATVAPCHIYGLLFSVIAPLLSGATVDRVARFFPQEIVERIEQADANVLIAGPAHLRSLTTTRWPRDRIGLAFSSGAPLAYRDARAFYDHAGLFPVEVYGSTETGGVATRIQNDPEAAWSPVPGVGVDIADGCLAVRSPHLGDDIPLDQHGYFRTADRARMLADGRFELLGRADGVVKVGGRRVDLVEIEQKLRSIPGVRDASVLARAVDSSRGQQVAALVESSRPSIEVLRAVRELLPTSAWPRALRCVERIPITSAGKRDREAIERLLFESTT